VRQFIELLESGLELNSNGQKLDDAFPRTLFIATARSFLLSPSREMRAASLYCLYIYVKEQTLLEALREQGLHYLISMSFEREKGATTERIQALKLVRSMQAIDPLAMPRCIVQSLVAVASDSDDILCSASLLALAEMATTNTAIVSLCGGIPVIISAAVSPLHKDIQQPLVLCLLYMLNNSKSRAYIRPQSDIRLLFAPLTNTCEVSSKTSSPAQQRQAWLCCISALCLMLKSF